MKIQQPRLRRSCLGELIQIDGCEHRWFEDRAAACMALVYVERAHLTLQDRLVKELRLAGICSIEAANVFIPRFIEAYNRRFAKAARNAHDAHRALRGEEELDLIFAWRELLTTSRCARSLG